MKLKTIKIDNFRSIELAELRDCGQFNVLIGKNSSGKSNILSAIELLFQFASMGQVATHRSFAKADTDYFQRNRTKPIELSAIFSVTESEATEIIDVIAAEAAQMANALESLRDFRGLAIRVSFLNTPTPMSFVRRISLLKGLEGNVESARNATLMLQLSDDAAKEIASRRQELLALEHDLDSMRQVSVRFDPDDFVRFKDNQRSAPPMPTSYLFRNVPALSRDRMQFVENSIRSSDSYETFLASLRDHIDGLQRSLRDNVESPNDSSINTFSGESHIIPGYITSTIDRIGHLRVLHLAERRKQIGEEEASRLLQLKMSRGKSGVLQAIQGTVTDLLGVEVIHIELCRR